MLSIFYVVKEVKAVLEALVEEVFAQKEQFFCMF